MRYGLIGILLAVASAAAAQRIEPASEGLAEATFAGGCFWCVEQAFDAVDGVEATISGYTGGNVDNPGYKAVSTGGTGHAEAVRIHYDPSVVSYAELLDVFWHNIDPTVEDRQFCDKGSQYRSAIFYHNAEQKRLAEKTRQRIDASGQLPGPVVTDIQPAGSFYRAEAYHQNYYKKNPSRYKFYKRACGRAERLRELWGDKAGG